LHVVQQVITQLIDVSNAAHLFDLEERKQVTVQLIEISNAAPSSTSRSANR